LYDKSGNLVTERTKVDITKLKKHLAPQDYENLRIIIREATVKLDAIHSYIESYLNARVQNSD
tara:strand:+ start:146 stop:334 length:189 start_codon:yes stop_codon:yes gene_type:complete